MRRLAPTLCALALSTVGSAAFATTGQDDGGLARAAATDVVVFDVLKVRPLLKGEVASCRVFGRAIRAERGARYKPRQSVRLTVPCATQGAGSSDSVPKWVDREALVRSAHGRAFLASDGVLIAYELYDLH
ncbi:hypothetical protein PMI01_02838 [Caulobacter sp. AP07]|uniref:hypothetical protein n=1 Tax=Caulobacter sp. AP07 TaxID=1144304 RepID=UPI0002722538|nr:hypothetical protein [Caulobacter sp. AP07]EJL31270.1 hypothetical protein PMI01_02838 [Caulobacter sp. AP07]